MEVKKILSYDYTIRRNLRRDKTTTLTPKLLPKELENFVLIEGPNSSGKSTLLNIVALGLFGLKSSKIHPILKDKMASLLDLDHQKIIFSFTVGSKDNQVFLRSRKSDLNGTDFILEESKDGIKFKPLSFETFQRKYNLIYDIPNNPIARLPDLLTELKDEQLQFGNSFKDFGIYLRNVITEINTSRNPKRLKELQDRLEKEEKTKGDIEKEIPQLEEFLNQLEINAYLDYFYNYSNKAAKLASEFDLLEKQIKKMKKYNRQINTQRSKNKKKLEKLQGEFSTSYQDITPIMKKLLPKKERLRFKIWEGMNPYCTEREDLNTMKVEIAYFQDLFSKEIDLLRKNESFISAMTMEQLFCALKEFEFSRFRIPQLKVTIGDLVNILKKECSLGSVLIAKHENLKAILEELDVLKEIVRNLQTTERELGQNSCETFTEDDEYFKINKQLKNMETDLQELVRKANKYTQLCVSKDFSPEQLDKTTHKTLLRQLPPRSSKIEWYLTLSEEQVLAQIKKLHEEITSKRGELVGLEVVIKTHSQEVKTLESQEPHKFENNVETIAKLLRKIDAISQKILSKYKTNLKNLKNKKNTSYQKLSEDEKKYCNEVSKYLAHRIGTFTHINENYKAVSVDLISGKIMTESGDSLYIIDMGTGQSQSTYLKSLLNAKNDDRKIIALFDEIETMDNKSLKPILSKLQQLYKADRLLLGILVQRRDDELKIRNLIRC